MVVRTVSTTPSATIRHAWMAVIAHLEDLKITLALAQVRIDTFTNKTKQI